MNFTEINKLINKFFELLNNKDFKNLQNFLSPDVVFYFPGTKPLHGHKKVIQLFRVIYRRYPDLTFKIKDMIIQKNKIATVWENSGNDTKGNPYQNEGVTLFKIEDGKVKYISDYFKDTSFTITSDKAISEN